jgi:hypothetical protein
MTDPAEFDMGEYWLALDGDPAVDPYGEDDADIEADWARDEAGS